MNVEAAGYASAEDFLAEFDDSRCGCLISETRLPGMSGLELFASLSQLRHRMPLLVLWADVDVPLAVEAMHLGALTVFEKPYRDEELKQAILKSLAISRRAQQKWALIGEIDERLKTLTTNERRTLDLLWAGKTNKTVAVELSNSLRTVEYDRQVILNKMGVLSLIELVPLVCEWRLSRGENPTSISVHDAIYLSTLISDRLPGD